MLLRTVQNQQRASSAALVRWLIVGAIGVMLCLSAAENTLATPEAIEEGRRIALHAPDDIRCARCHGKLGQGDRSAGHPRLTKQSRFYLRKQLEDFASEERPSEDMAPIARALTQDQWEAVAAYYASIREAPYPTRPEGDPRLLQQGGALSAIGSVERHIRACALCHADTGTGIQPSYPYLAGQFADYTERQLQLWKQGLRRNDPLEVMADIAKKLSDEEIRGLALYFARAQLPADRINDLTPAESEP